MLPSKLTLFFFLYINKLMNEFIDTKNNNVSRGIYVLYYRTAQQCLAQWNKLNRLNRYDHRIIRIENTIIKYKLYYPSDLDNRQTKWQISHDRWYNISVQLQDNSNRTTAQYNLL